MTLPHTDFDEVFAGGRFGAYDASVRRVGELVVTSGGVAIFDPECGHRIDVPSVPVGTYPIEAAIATRGGRDSVAALRIVFERARASSWELQKPYRDRPHPPFEIAGVYIESGHVAFADSQTHLGYARPEDVITFEVRTRDLQYAIHLGRTSDGRVATLAVDSALLTVPLFEQVELALPLEVGRLDDARFTLIGVEAWAISPSELELRGDVARLCSARAGETSIDPIVQTQPSFVQRFTFPSTSGPAFVKLYVGCAALARS